MAKLHYTYDMELMEKTLDWLQQSHMHVMWWKPALYVRFSPAESVEGGKVQGVIR